MLDVCVKRMNEEEEGGGAGASDRFIPLCACYSWWSMCIQGRYDGKNSRCKVKVKDALMCAMESHCVCVTVHLPSQVQAQVPCLLRSMRKYSQQS